VPRRIVRKPTEELVATALVELRRLEVEGAQKGSAGAHSKGLPFSRLEKLTAEATPAAFVGNPEVRDVEPFAPHVSKESTPDSSTPIPDEQGHRVDLRQPSRCEVEPMQPLPYDGRLGRSRVGLRRNGESLRTHGASPRRTTAARLPSLHLVRPLGLELRTSSSRRPTEVHCTATQDDLSHERHGDDPGIGQ